MERSREKPEGARSGWRFLGSATRFQGDVFRVGDSVTERILFVTKEGKMMKNAARS